MNPEKRAVTRTRVELIDFMYNCPRKISEALLARELITGDLCREASTVRSSSVVGKIVSYLSDRVGPNPRELVDIVDALLQIPGSDNVVKKLKENYAQLGGTQALPSRAVSTVKVSRRDSGHGVTRQENVTDQRDMTIQDIMRFLKERDFLARNARKLGMGLGLPSRTINELKKENPDLEEMLMAIIDHWVHNDSNKSWDKLINLVDEIQPLRKSSLPKPRRRADREKVSKSTTTNINEDEEEIEKFIKEIENAIFKDGKIDRKLAHIMFVGPPGSGKSSLMDRLLGRLKKKFSASTGVCDSIVIVDIDVDNPSTFRSAIIDSQTWREIENDKSFVSQMGKESIVGHPQRKAKLPDTQNIGPSVFNLAKDTLVKAARAVQTTFSTSTITTPYRENVDSVIKKYGFKTLKGYLNKTCSLYLRDTGGQVEFQEMLALLISGPSIFFFVFRADLDFQGKFEVQYRKSTSESLNTYTSSITIEEALLQSLASVYAMDTSSKKIGSHDPLVFLVGTHIDKLGFQREAKLADLNQHLDSTIKSSGFSDLVLYANKKKGQVMFAVDNTSKDEKSFHLIRSKINHIMNRKEFSIEYPISYLLFCLDLQNIKKSVITLEECRKLAASHGIMGDQVLHLLHFLHLRIGLIRYYDVEGLRDLIFVQPQVLFSKTTDLIAITFSSGSLFPKEATDLERKGILSADVLKSHASFNEITPEQFLQLIVHLRIAAPLCLPGDKVERFFLPCVLNHVPESTKEDLKSNITPLFIKFKCNHCPKGIYGVLVTHLMQPEEDDSKSKFTLIEDKIFKDQVSFELSSAGVLDKISLKVFPSHIEIKFFPEHSELRTASVGEVCSNVRQVIEKSILRSLKDLHYQKEKVEPVMSFKCDHCTQLHPIENKNNFYVLQCKTFGKTSHISPNGRHWYNEDDIKSREKGGICKWLVVLVVVLVAIGGFALYGGHMVDHKANWDHGETSTLSDGIGKEYIRTDMDHAVTSTSSDGCTEIRSSGDLEKMLEELNIPHSKMCRDLGIQKSTCMTLERNNNLRVDTMAPKYLEERERPCWEDIVDFLCQAKYKNMAWRVKNTYGISDQTYSKYCKVD